ncbi:hypothetical protein [Salinivirga cyanobacteriivorans]
MKRKIIYTMTFIVIIVALTINVQGTQINKSFDKRESKRLNTFSSIQDYLKSNVFPVIGPLRSDFEKNLSDDEKAEIKEIRKEIVDIVNDRYSLEVSFIHLSLFEKELTDEQVSTMKETRERFYDVMLKAMVINNNHKVEIGNLLQTEKVNREIWRNDIQNILKENAPKRALVLSPILKQNFEKLFPVEKAVQIMFLLWNPEEPILIKFH